MGCENGPSYFVVAYFSIELHDGSDDDSDSDDEGDGVPPGV